MNMLMSRLTSIVNVLPRFETAREALCQQQAIIQQARQTSEQIGRKEEKQVDGLVDDGQTDRQFTLSSS